QGEGAVLAAAPAHPCRGPLCHLNCSVISCSVISIALSSVDVGAVTAALFAAEAAVREVRGREHEEAGHRVDVAELARVEGGVVGGEDLGALWMVDAEAIRVWLAQVSGTQPLGRHGPSLRSAKAREACVHDGALRCRRP